MIAAEVQRSRARSGWTAGRTLQALGVAPSTFYRQHRRLRSVPAFHASPPVRVHEALPAEREAVLAFARLHPELRHRPLAWTMVDEDIAYLSASTVYRTLREADLIARWQPRQQIRGTRAPRPQAPNRLWQTDLRHVKIDRLTYYLLVFLDVFSRFIVYHELLRWMDGKSVALSAQNALETLPRQARRKIRIQSDNGSAYVSADFARVLREHGTLHHRIHPHTPEQNGCVERVLRTLGEPLHEHELETYAQACRASGEIIHWYNHERLHSAIGYLTPAAVHFGDAERIQTERRDKLAAARHYRKEENLKIRQRSLPVPGSLASREPQATVHTHLSHFP